MLFAGVAEAGMEARWAFTFADAYVYRILLVSGTLEPGIRALAARHTLYDAPPLIPDSLSTLPDWVATGQTTGVEADDILLNGKDDTPKQPNKSASQFSGVPDWSPVDRTILRGQHDIKFFNLNELLFIRGWHPGCSFAATKGATVMVSRNSNVETQWPIQLPWERPPPESWSSKCQRPVPSVDPSSV